MPFKKDPAGVGREHANYCSYCFADGKLVYAGDDLKGFRKAMIASMVERGESRIKARLFAFIAGFAKRWRGK